MEYIRIIDIKHQLGDKVGYDCLMNLLKEFNPHIEIIDKRKARVIDKPDDMGKLQEVINKKKEEMEMRAIKEPIKRFDYLMEKITADKKQKYPFTIKTFEEFARASIVKSNRTDVMWYVMKLHTTLMTLMDCLDKDINKLNQEEMSTIFQKDFPSGLWVHMNAYFIYLRKNYSKAIKSTEQFTYYAEKKLKTEDDFYSKEEWMQYLNFAIDIDLHLKKAFTNEIYAKCWLYILLHFSLAWRRNDILSLPALENLIGIEQYNLKWFSENAFKQEDAFYIITNTKMIAEQYHTAKTDAALHFNIAISLMTPTALAIIMAEQWRRKKTAENIFGSTTINGSVLTKYLGEKIKGFSSLKANRTLLSFANKTAEELGEENAISIASYMRSHKMDEYKYSDATMVYLKSTYHPEETTLLSKSLFEKGAFGWLYETILEAYTEEEQKGMKETGEIAVLERASKFLTNEKCKRELVINEVLGYPKDMLKKVLLGEVVSRQEHVYCLNQQNCKHKLKSNCLDCKYAVPTIYALYSAADEIESLLQKINSLDKKYINDRSRYTYRLLKLIQVMKEAANTFGIEIVNEFVDINKILMQTNKILKESDDK